jgi:hypothetical protein
MSDVIQYDKSVQANCTVEGISGINQKGAYVKVMIKIPLTADNPEASKEMAGELMNHLGNVARVTLEFSSMKAGSRGGVRPDEDPSQLTLADTEEETD